MMRWFRYSFPLLIVGSFILAYRLLFPTLASRYTDVGMTCQLLIYLVEIGISAVYFLKLREQSFVKRSSSRLFSVILSLFLFFLVRLGLPQFMAFFPRHVPQNQLTLDGLSFLKMSVFARGGDLFISAMLAPIFEELLFRGILMRLYFKDSPYFIDVLWSGFFFGILHVLFYPLNWLSLVDILFYALPGVSLAILFRFSKSIYYPLALHIAWNMVDNWSLIYNFIYWNFLV